MPKTQRQKKPKFQSHNPSKTRAVHSCPNCGKDDVPGAFYTLCDICRRNPIAFPFIVKLQLPIETNEPTPLALLYNWDRSITSQTPVTDQIRKLVPNGLKAYMYARIQGNSLELLREPKVEKPPHW